MKCFFISHLNASVSGLVGVIFAAMVCCSPALAVVVIRDGFGDADLNNNGVPFEDVDTNVQGSLTDTTWIPGRINSTLPGDFNGDQRVNAADYAIWRDNLGEASETLINDAGDGVPGVSSADYTVWRSSFGSSFENHELTAPALDPLDTGIRWLQMRGFTSAPSSSVPGSGDSKPFLHIVNDSQGAMLETRPTSVPGGLGFAAIDSGNAMSWESKGGGGSAAGFFGQRISLGTAVDDEVIVSFDFRLWRDTPNAEDLSPDASELRFGLFQDTDNQIGQTNPFAGRQVDANGDPTSAFMPAVWGTDEGMFNGALTGTQGAGDDVGSNGDAGWTAAVWLGDNISPSQQNGAGARIREEVQADRILEGSDVEFVASPPNIAADPLNDPPLYDFVDMDPTKVYNIALSLRRATETVEGDAILATLTITDLATLQVYSFSGLEQDFASDSWDYFAMRNASSGSNEIDFLIDNFMVEVIGSNAPALLSSSGSVPEPASIVMLCVAGLSLLGFNCFRR